MRIFEILSRLVCRKKNKKEDKEEETVIEEQGISKINCMPAECYYE